MNIYLVVIVALILFDYVLNLVVELINLRHLRTSIPREFKGWYDTEKYARSQEYLKDNTRFDLVSSTLMTAFTLAFILLGGFRYLDALARDVGGGMILTGLVFGGLLLLGIQVLQIPFSLYATFVLEERYGFNRTRPLTFVADLLKGLALSLVIGGLVFAAVLWFFARAGSVAWLYSWAAVIVFQFVMMYLAPVFILPLFNKFTPLEEGELKEAVSGYARQQGFSLKGLFTMDGSRRSAKSNAYFTGFGRWRRIVLFDTLVEKHDTDELVGVLAHEVGHYKLKHIHKMLAASTLITGLMFFILSLFISRPGLYQAFGLDFTPVQGEPPIYAGMVFFGFLYAPLSMIFSLALNTLSRKHEYEADNYAVKTTGRAEPFIVALKKLTVDNLSNLTPHPLKVFLEYSHPPVLDRIRSIREGCG